MSKNILVLTGSPRARSNSDRMADAFIKGAEAAGHTVTKYKTAEKKIGGCRACNQCYSKGKACVFDDDFNKLAPLMEDADVVVLVTPLYWFSFPAQIKAAIDRFHAMTMAKRPIQGKECVLMVSAADSDIQVFGGIQRSYELIAQYLNWKDRGQLYAKNVYEPGDIEKTDLLKRAEELGSIV